MRLLNILFISGLAVTSAVAQVEAQRGQGPQVAQAPRPSGTVEVLTAGIDMRNAYETKQSLQSVLRRYPPSLAEVLRLDPSLLTNQAYLTPYPNLAAFLSQHPEIAHNPTFFLGSGDENYYRANINPEERSYRMFEAVMAATGLGLGLILVFSVFAWVIKTIIDHRRWLRVSKIQSEVHSKLLDRFTSNQELLAYVQTPAGRRFLESAPVTVDSRSMAAPFGRILFSIQAGIVLALAGLGLNLVSNWLLVADIAQPLFVIGVLALAVGIGFIISGAAAYVMSKRLGLFDQTPLSSASDNAGVSPPNA